MTATESLNSLARCTTILGRPFGVVTRAVKSLGIAPAVSLDGCNYFTDAQVEQLREYLSGTRQTVEGTNG